MSKHTAQTKPASKAGHAARTPVREKKVNEKDDWVTLDREALVRFTKDATARDGAEVDLSTFRGSDAADVKTGTDDKESVVPSPVPVKLGALLKGIRGTRGMYYRTDLHYGYYVGTNGTASKYALTFGGSAALPTTDLTSTGEWTSFNSVFEEFFIHKMVLQYQPSNQFLAGYINATSTNLQSSMLVLAGYQHNQTPPADASTNFFLYLNSSQARVAHTARPWKFVWKNIEKFEKNGTVGDGTTSGHTQAWMNIGSAAKYGGAVYACTPYATSASPSAVLYPTAAELGFVTVTYDVSFRYRD